jgi:hypothetical protein
MYLLMDGTLFYACQYCHTELEHRQVLWMRAMETVGNDQDLIIEITYACGCLDDGDEAVQLCKYDASAMRRLTGRTRPPASDSAIAHELAMLAFATALAGIETAADLLQHWQ